MPSFLSDLRIAARSLLRSPSFSIAAIVALGLGIGSAAGVFSLVQGVVLRPLPYREPDRLVTIWDANREKGLDHEPLSPVNFMDYRALPAVFEDAAVWWRPQLNLTDETGDPIRISAIETSENLFAVLGVGPLIGRGFVVHPELYGRENEAVISHRLWQSRFSADRGVIGRAVRLNGFSYTIVGVMPRGFAFPGDTDLWQQLQWSLTQHSRGAHFMEAIARLRPGVTPERASRELAGLTGRLANEFKTTNGGWSARAVALDRETVGVFRPALFALLGASGLLLLIACINVANLLLARATSRRREVALRMAIGASRGRLIRLFLAESVVLTMAGSVLALGISALSVRALLAWSPIRIPRADEVGVDVTVLVFAIVIAAITAIASGLVPAILMSRGEMHDALKDGAKGTGGRGGTTRSVLVVAEVSLAVALLSGAGLLIRSVGQLLRVNTGVDATSVMTAEMQLPDVAYREWPRVDQFYRSLTDALRARPEVSAVGVSSFLPLDPGWRLPFLVAGAAPVPGGDEPTAQFHSADSGYFAALRVPLVRGRMFGGQDDASTPSVVVVNEALARRMWPGESAIGKRIVARIRAIGPLGRRLSNGDEHEVIGVVSDVKNTSLRVEAEPAVYFPEQQFPYRKMNLVVRGRGDAAQLAGLIREELRRIDPAVAPPNVRPMTRVLATSVDPSRFVMLLMTVFAGLALTLAAVGIYGMLSYAVNHRRKEFGIRLALGAQPAAVLRLIVREGLTLAVAGCVIGIAGAYAAGRSLSGFLFGVAPFDPATLGGVVAVVIAVALVACLVPGRRASAEDPVNSLRP